MPAPDETLSALAFLYLTFGQTTDGKLTGDEMRELAKKLQDWAPEATLETIGEVLKSTVGEFKTLTTKADRLKRAGEYSTQLKGVLAADQAQRIIDDLRAIANADGMISPDELEFISQTARSLGVTLEIG